MRSAATSTSSNSEFFDVRLMHSLVARSVPLFYFTLLDRVQRQLHRERDQLRSMRSETARGHARAQLDLCLDVCEEGSKLTRPLVDGPATFGPSRFTALGRPQSLAIPSSDVSIARHKRSRDGARYRSAPVTNLKTFRRCIAASPIPEGASVSEQATQD